MWSELGRGRKGNCNFAGPVCSNTPETHAETDARELVYKLQRPTEEAIGGSLRFSAGAKLI